MEQCGWMTREYRAAGRYLTHLIGCALKGTDAEEKPEGFTWEQVYKLAESNGVAGLSYYGVTTLKHLPPSPLYERWKEEMNQAFYRMLHFDAEREQITEEMTLLGLAYLPLKGIRLAGFYPKPGMRSMADNDILYGFVKASQDGGFRILGRNGEEQEAAIRAAQKAMTKIMTARGYRTEGMTGSHDSYTKQPFYNFEMHRKLMPEGSLLHEYYKNPWKRAVRNPGNHSGFSFSDEDDYLYFLAHSFKHYSESGCGIRCLADRYVFLEKKGAGMDWNYIRGELLKMELSDYEESLKRLSASVFEPGQTLSPREEDFLYDLLGCGTYGNRLARMERSLSRLQAEGKTFRQAKWKYIWRKMYLPAELCKEYYPLCYRHKCLRLLLPFYRLWKRVRNGPGNLWVEFKNFWNYNK